MNSRFLNGILEFGFRVMFTCLRRPLKPGLFEVTRSCIDGGTTTEYSRPQDLMPRKVSPVSGRENRKKRKGRSFFLSLSLGGGWKGLLGPGV